jgi:hypothetical protein
MRSLVSVSSRSTGVRAIIGALGAFARPPPAAAHAASQIQATVSRSKGTLSLSEPLAAVMALGKMGGSGLAPLFVPCLPRRRAAGWRTCRRLFDP